MRDADTVELRIERVGVRGDGVAHWQGEPVFVPFAAPGDRVRATLGPKRGAGRAARLREIVENGARVEAPCRHFGACGGCVLQHLDDAAYVATKDQWLRTALAQQHLAPERIAPLARLARGTRRRARFHLAEGRVGFHARGSHRVVDLEECHVLHPKLVALVPALREFAPRAAALAASATLADNGIDLLLDLPDRPALAALEAMAGLAEAGDLARLAWREGGRVALAAERRKPTVSLSDVAVALPEDAFMQPSAEAEAALVAAVATLAVGAKNVADLYAGIGTFSFALVSRAKIRAVEADEAAVAAVGEAAARAGLAGRLTAKRRNLAAQPLGMDELADLDTVVFDPPYAGAPAQCRVLARSRVPRIVAVSCNPASFARDARILAEGGYRLTTVMPFDAFPWSANLELVAGFERS